jgi:tetratricopeptide (TPR) repeat protein
VKLAHTLPVWSIAFTPDNTVLTTGGEGITRLWHLPPQPKDLEQVQSQTWKTLGFRMDEQGNQVYLDSPTNGVEEIRARLTQAPKSADTPVDAALKLPPAEALSALRQLADQHAGTTVYRKLLGGLHADLISLAAKQGLWSEALAHADEAIRLDHDNPYMRFQRALIALAAGDNARYRAECRTMVELYSQSDDLGVIQWVGSAVALAPGALEDYSDLITQLRRAASRVGETQAGAYSFFLGAVLARAEPAEAVAEFEKAGRYVQTEGVSSDFGSIHYQFLLAICHAQLGHEDIARQWFDAAARDVQKNTPPASTVSWNRRLTLELLKKEAQSLLIPEAAHSATN